MKVQTQASKVLERTSHYLKAGVIRNKPAWYDIVAAVPPTFDLTKKPKNLRVNQKEDPAMLLWQASNEGQKTRTSKQCRKQKNNSAANIPKLEFLEDQLRDIFYHQHPWEFSRPKIIVENKGNDSDNCNWSRMLQLQKPLDGESVVQRTLWLLKESKKTEQEKSLFDAYDEARFEFYQLRMAEEADSSISREEASMFGAVFPYTFTKSGLENEQEYIDEWVKVGGEKTKVLEASRSKPSATEVESVESSGSIWETAFTEEESV